MYYRLPSQSQKRAFMATIDVVIRITRILEQKYGKGKFQNRKPHLSRAFSRLHESSGEYDIKATISQIDSNFFDGYEQDKQEIELIILDFLKDCYCKSR